MLELNNVCSSNDMYPDEVIMNAIFNDTLEVFDGHHQLARKVDLLTVEAHKFSRDVGIGVDVMNNKIALTISMKSDDFRRYIDGA